MIFSEPRALLSSVAGAIDGTLLLVGDEPPAGSDLDLVVREGDLASAEASLRDQGYARRGREWVRLAPPGVDVDLVPASAWRLPAEEIERVFAEARSVGGLAGVVRPGPHHRVLLLARRIHWGSSIDDRRWRRLQDALAEEPDVAARARAAARAWGVGDALERLLEMDGPDEDPEAQRPAGAGGPRLRFTVRHPRRVWRDRRARPAVVALSGIDGSGKSQLAATIVRHLEGTGTTAKVVWTRLEWTTMYENRTLGVVAAPARWAVRAVTQGHRRGSERAAAPASGEHPPGDWTTPRPDDGLRRLRQRSRLLNTAWALFVAFVHARAQRDAVRGAGTDVVVCDRYTLDSVVHLRRHYELDRRSATWPGRLMVRMSVRPVVAVLLDLPAEVALQRKQDVFDLPSLRSHAALYREEHARLGVEALDAARPADDIASEVAGRVWEALPPRL